MPTPETSSPHGPIRPAALLTPVQPPIGALSGVNLAQTFAQRLDDKREAPGPAPNPPDGSGASAIKVTRASRTGSSGRPESGASQAQPKPDAARVMRPESRLSAVGKTEARMRDAAVIDITQLAVQEQSDPGASVHIAAPPQSGAETSDFHDEGSTGNAAGARGDTGRANASGLQNESASAPQAGVDRGPAAGRTQSWEASASAARAPEASLIAAGRESGGPAFGPVLSRPTVGAQARGPVGAVGSIGAAAASTASSARAAAGPGQPARGTVDGALARLGASGLAVQVSKLRSPGAMAAHRTAGRTQPAPPKTLASQVERGLAAAIRHGKGSVTIRLQPETLGAMRIRIAVEEGRVAARLEASSDAARKLLNETLPALRTALESRGLAVERLEVDAPPQALDVPRESEPARPEVGQSKGGASGGAGESGQGGLGRGWDSPWGGGAASGQSAAERAVPEDPGEGKDARQIVIAPRVASSGGPGVGLSRAVIDAVA